MTVAKIQTGLPSVTDVEGRKRLEEVAARIAAANDNMLLSDLRTLQNQANAAVQILDDANEFKNVSAIADQRVAGIEELLKQITSDAPIIHDLKNAIQDLRKELAGSNLAALKGALAKLNSLYETNQKKLNALKFDVY